MGGGAGGGGPRSGRGSGIEELLAQLSRGLVQVGGGGRGEGGGGGGALEELFADLSAGDFEVCASDILSIASKAILHTLVKLPLGVSDGVWACR